MKSIYHANRNSRSSEELKRHIINTFNSHFQLLWENAESSRSKFLLSSLTKPNIDDPLNVKLKKFQEVFDALTPVLFCAGDTPEILDKCRNFGMSRISMQYLISFKGVMKELNRLNSLNEFFILPMETIMLAYEHICIKLRFQIAQDFGCVTLDEQESLWISRVFSNFFRRYKYRGEKGIDEFQSIVDYIKDKLYGGKQVKMSFIKRRTIDSSFVNNFMYLFFSILQDMNHSEIDILKLVKKSLNGNTSFLLRLIFECATGSMNYDISTNEIYHQLFNLYRLLLPEEKFLSEKEFEERKGTIESDSMYEGRYRNYCVHRVMRLITSE